MNLHIVPDNTFINAFYDNLKSLGLLSANRIVVRTNHPTLSAVKRDVPFGRLYSQGFEELVGDTRSYDRVFVHYFTPLLYRWVARHAFRELNWMIWGGDLYNLPGLDETCYEPLTRQYVRNDRSLNTLLYRAKVRLLHQPYRARAYQKVNNLLTWMDQEYTFACDNLPIKAGHQFFFYENQQPYQALDGISPSTNPQPLTIMIGNSGTPSNNHLDTVKFLDEHAVPANLTIPVSYGDHRYIRFLKKRITYRHGSVTFVDKFMPFHEYVELLLSVDALVMNTIRPQGYGNILMMLYLNKPVFLNARNTSLSELSAAGIHCPTLPDLPRLIKKGLVIENKAKVVSLLSHERLLSTYRQLFN